MKGLLSDVRGNSDAAKAVGLVITLAVFGIVGAFLVPVAVDEINADQSTVINQTVGTTEDVNAELNTTLDSIDGTADSATYTLQTDAQSNTVTVDNGTTETVTFDRGDVNVTVSDVDAGSNTATASYAYPKDFAYSSGASALWSLLGLAIILALFLYSIKLAMSGNRL